MFELLNKEYQKIQKFGLNLKFKLDFQSLSTNTMPPAVGIPHGQNDLSDVPRYGKALDKPFNPNVNAQPTTAPTAGNVESKPSNQPLVPGSTRHTPVQVNAGKPLLSISPALHDAGFEYKDGLAEKVIDSTTCEETGFIRRRKLVAFGDDTPDHAIELEAYYNNMGDYIGDKRFAKTLHKAGIYPEKLSPSHKVCSIGYCKRDKKWYGWSHRAMYGFGVGSEVKPGDCAYTPPSVEDATKEIENMYNDSRPTSSIKYRATPYKQDNDNIVIKVVCWKYSEDEYARDRDSSHIPPEDMGWVMDPKPEFVSIPLGKGSWTAETEEDARKMACDFARSVSSAEVCEPYPEDDTTSKDKFESIFEDLYNHLDKVFNNAKPARLKAGHMTSCSSSAIYPPLNFAWYKAVEDGTAIFDEIKQDMSLTLEAGDKFGIHYNQENDTVYLVTAEDLSYMFSATPRKMKNALKRAKPFGGKVSGLTVTRGNGDVKQLTTDKILKRSRDITSIKISTVEEAPKKAQLRRPSGKVTIVPNPDAKTFFGFYKPDLDRERFEIMVDSSKTRLAKALKERASQKSNLGSPLFVMELKESHPLVKKYNGKPTFVNSAIISKLRDTNTAHKLKTDFKLGNMTLQLPARNPSPLSLDVPIGPGIEVVALRALRDQIEQHRKISAAFTVREGSNKKQDRGIFVHDGVNILQFISPSDSPVYDREAKAFERRIKTEASDKFIVKWKRLSVVIANKKQERVVITIFPNIKRGSVELRKRNKVVFRALEDKTLNYTSSYIARTKAGDIEVNLSGVNWNNGRLIVKPIRANLSTFETDELWSLATRSKVF